MDNIRRLTKKIELEVNPKFNNEKAIAKYRLLMSFYERNKDEEFKEKAKSIKDKIVYNNLPLIINIARKNEFPSKLNIEDLLSAGIIALLKCIDKFNLEKGLKFTTYVGDSATTKISDEISSWYGEGSSYYGKAIRIYRSMAIAMFGENDAIYDNENIDYILSIMLEQDLVRRGSIPEIKFRLLAGKSKEDDYTEIESLKDEENDEDGYAPFYQKISNMDYLPDDNDAEEEFDKSMTRIEFIREYKTKLYSLLTDRTREIIEYMYGFEDGKEHTKTDTAKRFGITRQAVDCHLNKAMPRMKKIAQAYIKR